MPWPKISIVTPSYNQGKFIERTVRSVLLQRYPNLEYIVMDGGSTDDTLDRLKPYQDRISHFGSERDHGQADALAKGFDRSSGEILAYLNSDDLLAPGALYFVANFFQANPHVDWIYSHRCTVDEDDRVIWYWILPPHQSFLMRRWDRIPQETCFWRRSLFEKTGNIDRSYKFAMDYDLFVRFMNIGRGRRINRFLGAFRDHSTSKTKQLLQTVGAREMLRVRRKYRITAAITDGIFELLLGNWVQYAGRYFVAAAHSLPGGLAGLGYDYNDVWGGLLRPNCCSSANPDESGQFENRSYSPLCPVTFSSADRVLLTLKYVEAGFAKTSAVYLNSKSGVAIIAPGTEETGSQLLTGTAKNRPANEQAAAKPIRTDGTRSVLGLAKTALESVCRLPIVSRPIKAPIPRRTAVDNIFRLTQGLVARDDDIAFLDASCSGEEVLRLLAACTRWRLHSLEPDYVTAKTLTKGCQALEAALEETLAISEMLGGFDFVHLGNGLERLHEPHVSLRSLAILMNPGGFLILITPNLDSEQQKLFGPAWTHWRPDEHRFIYSPKSLTKLLAQAGFSRSKLETSSRLESTKLSLKNLDAQYASDPGYENHSEIILGREAERITRNSHLIWDRLGKGDEIFAVFRRVS